MENEPNGDVKQPTARTIKKVERAAESVSNDLDKVIHERMRLGIISALAANESLSFNDLKKLLQTTDGNVSVHARKLEDAARNTSEGDLERALALVFDLERGLKGGSDLADELQVELAVMGLSDDRRPADQ